MCGIAGLLDRHATRPVDPQRLQQLSAALRHRGPDGEGTYHAPGIGLAHRRLAIIDPNGGHQPLCNEDQTIWVVFNGEIYNFQTLRQQLQQLGHHFRTRSDTEVILHAWESWGASAIERLSGMFALALWDNNQRTLLLARDRLGMKPLYYTTTPDGWLGFASEFNALANDPGLSTASSFQALECYFALGYVPDPLSIHPEIYKLPPGSLLLIEADKSTPPPTRYWEPPFDSTARPTTLTQAAEELRIRLTETVHSHLIADVPVAAFLSGGLDSSAITSLMARNSDTPVQACTVAFADSSCDETSHASRVAAHCGLQHHVEHIDPARFDLLEQLAHHYGEPFADPSALPTWLVCAMARRHAKVVLSGDGGDENFAGYSRYHHLMTEEKIRTRLPANLRHLLFGLPGRWYPKLDRAPRWLRAQSTLRSLGKNWVEAAFQSVSILPDEWRQRLFSDHFHRQLQGFRAETIWYDYAANAPEHPLSRLQYLDMKGFLAGRVLVKVDRASMAHGLEVRAPLLDYQLVEWLASLPPEWKLDQGSGKKIFKEALQPWLPADILRRPKQGFNLPLAAWLRGELAQPLRQRLFGPTLADTGWFRPETLRHLVEAHLAGRRDFSAPLWALLMCEAHVRQKNGY